MFHTNTDCGQIKMCSSRAMKRV